MREEDNPRYVLYSSAFRGKHQFKGLMYKTKIMARISTDEIFRAIVLSIRMKGDTPRVFIDRHAVAQHMNHRTCTNVCVSVPDERGYSE